MRRQRWLKHAIYFYDKHQEDVDAVSRKTKKAINGTRSSRRREEAARIKEQRECSHAKWETWWSYIPGEAVMEPDHDYCVECGITDMQLWRQQGMFRKKLAVLPI